MAINGRKPRRTQLDKFDADILEFAKRWAPFGGGHEFVLAEFGINIGGFYHRLHWILQELEPHERDPKVVTITQHNYAAHHGPP